MRECSLFLNFVCENIFELKFAFTMPLFVKIVSVNFELKINENVVVSDLISINLTFSYSWKEISLGTLSKNLL